MRSAPAREHADVKDNSGQGEFCLPDNRFVRRPARTFVDFRAEQAGIRHYSALRFRPRSREPQTRCAIERGDRPAIDSLAVSLLNLAADRLRRSISCSRRARRGQTFDSPDRALSQILFRECDESCFVALLLLECGTVFWVMNRAGVCAQCASAAHDAGERQLGHIRARTRANSVRARLATAFRFVTQSAECASVRDCASDKPTKTESYIVRKSSRGIEKRLSLESGRCTFAGSRVTQPSEVAGQDIRLAHLVTTDSAA